MKTALSAFCCFLAVQYCSCAPWGIGSIGDWFKNASDAAGKWVDGAVKDTGEWVDGAVKDTGKWVDGAANDTGKWVEGAAKDTGKWVEGAAKDTGKWVEGAARDTKTWVEGAAGSVTDFFNKAGEEITKAFNVVKDKWNDFENDANNFFKNAGEGVTKAIDDIKKRIDETGDSVVKIIFEKIFEGLQDAKNKLEELRQTADEKFEEAMKVVHENLFTATSQVENFMNRMKSVIETKKEKDRGMDILESYLRESTEQIESCSEATIEPIRDLYESTKELMTSAINKLEEFLKEMEECLNNGASVKTAKCGKNLKKIAKESLKELGGELLGMKATLISTAIGEVTNVVCIGKTRIDVELAKSKVEAEINSLQ